ncbi:MAG: SusC/RagA family TonB-linked outer membrane protein [Bacteroidota bacterium]
MKLIVLFIMLGCIQVSANSFGQNITLTANKQPLTEVFATIEKQSGYNFFWKGNDLKGYKVSVDLKGASLKETMNTLLKDLPFVYSIAKNTIVIKERNQLAPALSTAFVLPYDLTIKVVDSTGSNLPGASIKILETNKVYATDVNGEVTIKGLTTEYTLSISYLGFSTAEVKVGGTTVSPLRVTLKPSNLALRDIVIVGYGSQKKQTISTAISSISSETIGKLSITRIEQALQGNAPGVLVLNQNGQPGDKPMIRIRGTGTNNSPDPLFIVDGFPVSSIEYLNPGDIDRIDILKDAASSAIYGARGANGVVLITTKTGKPGTTSLTYEGYYGTQNAWRKVPLLNATQYAEMMNEGARNANPNNVIPYPNTSNLGTGTNWQDALFSSNVPMLDQQVTASGGTDKGTYLAKFSYFDQQGVIGGKNSEFERYTFRLNLDQKLSSFLKIGTNLNYINSKRNAIFDNGDQGGHVLGNAINIDPITPLYETDPAKLAAYNVNAVKNGSQVYGISPLATYANPLAQLSILNGATKVDKLLGNIYADLTLYKGLKFKSSYGIDLSNINVNSYSPLYYLLPTSNQNYARVSSSFNRSFTWQVENVLSYSIDIAKHNIQAIAGQSAYRYFIQNLGGSRNDSSPIDPSLAYIDVATDVTSSINNGGADERTLSSYFGRLAYTYDNKYMLSGVLRRDGSSRFGRNNPYATFPSVSAGWVISKENFFPQNGVVSFAKIRASWGQNGNENLGSSFPWASTINAANNGYTYVDASGAEYILSGASLSAIANPDLKWETSEQTDFGVDINLFNDKLNITADYYKKVTKDLLIRPSILATVGYTAPYVNGGNVENKGIELGLNYSGKLGEDFKISSSFNFSYNKNEVTQINNASKSISGAAYISLGNITRMAVGQPIGYFYGQRTAGIFQTQEAVDAYTFTNPNTGVVSRIQNNAKPGDLKFIDTNNDGKIDDNDRVNIGDPNPKFITGYNLNLSYKNFDFNVFAIGMFGHKIFNGNYRFDKTVSNMPATRLDYWTPTNTGAKYPRFITTDPNKNYATVSDLLLENGDFVRIKNIQLGYTLPTTLVNKIKLSQLRIYMAVDNAFTITNYTGFDPEIGATSPLSMGIDRGVYPQSRTFRFGISAKL